MTTGNANFTYLGGYAYDEDDLIVPLVRIGGFEERAPAEPPSEDDLRRLYAERLAEEGRWSYRYKSAEERRTESTDDDFDPLASFPAITREELGWTHQRVTFGYDLSPAVLRRGTLFREGWLPLWWGVGYEWVQEGLKAVSNEAALFNPRVPPRVKKRIRQRVFLNGLSTLLQEHLRAYYRHENKNDKHKYGRHPRPVVDFRPAPIQVTSLTTGEPIGVIKPTISVGRRVYLLQKARRKQREGVVELTGFIASRTARWAKKEGVKTSLGRALDRWGDERFMERLLAELPGALYMAYFYGRPADEGDPDVWRQLVEDKYMESARKLGYKWDKKTRTWAEVPDGLPLPAPLDTELDRLAQTTRDWITADNEKENEDVIGGNALEWVGGALVEVPRDEGGFDPTTDVDPHLENAPGYDPEDDHISASEEGDYDEGYELVPEDFDTHHHLNVDPQHKRLLSFDKLQHEAVECFRKWGLKSPDPKTRERFAEIPKAGLLSDTARQRLYPTYAAAVELDRLGVKKMPPLKPPQKKATHIRTGEAAVGDIAAFKIMAYPPLGLMRDELNSKNGSSPLGLTEKQREAWELYAAGWSHKDIARRLGITERSLEDRLSAAWNKVEAALGLSLVRSVVRSPMPREEFAWKDLRDARIKV